MSAAPKSYLVGQWGAWRGNLLAWFLQASADISLDAMSAKSKLATSCKQMIVENTGQSRTSSTLVEILKILLDNTGDWMKRKIWEWWSWWSRQEVEGREERYENEAGMEGAHCRLKRNKQIQTLIGHHTGCPVSMGGRTWCFDSDGSVESVSSPKWAAGTMLPFPPHVEFI